MSSCPTEGSLRVLASPEISLMAGVVLAAFYGRHACAGSCGAGGAEAGVWDWRWGLGRTSSRHLFFFLNTCMRIYGLGITCVRHFTVLRFYGFYGLSLVCDISCAALYSDGWHIGQHAFLCRRVLSAEGLEVLKCVGACSCNNERPIPEISISEIAVVYPKK